VNLSLNGDVISGRVSQSARVAAESWGEQNLYCPNCASLKLHRMAQHTQPNDFACPTCSSRFQLKGQKSRLGKTLASGAYDALKQSLQRDDTPSFYFLHYEPATWTVRNLLLVPHFAIPPSALVKRKGTAGCHLALDRIPVDARIAIVTTIKSSTTGDTECVMISRPEEVREKFHRLKPFSDIPAKQRALALDVLNIVRRIAGQGGSLDGGAGGVRRTAFTNAEVYAFERELASLHPGSRPLRDKIRRQLGVLRDTGFLAQPERGVWKLK
jgi:type II restriction enzyme